MEWLFMERWSPFVVGVGIGVLSWVAFLLSDRPIGCSTAFVRTSGMIERLLRGHRVREKPYYQKFAPVIDWEWMLVVGVIIGAFISSRLSGTFDLEWVPAFWAGNVNANPAGRWTAALAGGVIMGMGARWAGGCTSGHGISGTLQLAVSSWLAAISFFAGGITTAMLIYKVLL
jgi:uncharacterized membrane protein YedE/YeeE